MAVILSETREFARSIDADRKVLRQMMASLNDAACHVQKSRALIVSSRSLLERLAAPGVAAAESSQDPGEGWHV